jgi:anaerobic selenocysteine-containing dehydrogenase
MCSISKAKEEAEVSDDKKPGVQYSLYAARKSEETKIQGVSLGNINHAGTWAAVDVNSGKIVRIRPFHYNSKYPEFKTWTIEARGKRFESSKKSLISPLSLAYKKRIYSPNRILYPLKRVDWDPDGERNTQNRGKSKFQRISWKEASDIMAREINRLRKQYGPESIGLVEAAHGETKTIHACHGMNSLLMDCLGNGGEYTRLVGSPVSWEGSVWGSKHVWGFEPFGEEPADIHMLVDIARHTEMVLYWPCNVESLGWLYGGQVPGRICAFWKEVGIKSVFISPDFNSTAAVHADKWIPVLPNTDSALLLAIAYTWMKEGTYDKEYVATHTVGYDKFESYVLGDEDGIPKTPEWASAICKVPEWTIKALAREWASKVTSTAANHGGGLVRGLYSHETMRLQVLLLAMQGVGKPGVHQTMMIHLIGFQIQEGMQEIERLTTSSGYRCSAVTEFKSGAPPMQFMFRNRLADAVLNPPVTWRAGLIAKRKEQFIEHRYPKEGCSEIHMLWSDCPCDINCSSGGNKQIKALQSPKLEFIVMQHLSMENGCLYADLVLPISTKFELDDIGYEDYEFSALYLEHKCVEPLGESKSDYEALIALAENLGVKDKYTAGLHGSTHFISIPDSCHDISWTFAIS